MEIKGLLFTPIELEELKQQLKKEILEDVEKKYPTYNKYECAEYVRVREKYCNRKNGLLRDKYPPYEMYQIWERIRRLSVIASGCQYVREMDNEQIEKAAQIADELCQIMLKGEFVK